ncbi:MAG: hypothetical protein A3C82_02695 [Candidatus Wildermuthbacteria bacterium RIFCSPHIGHO2_02_FULL_47_12]|uniref:DoxX family protein n=1 Tax=Candidatus Wildermuthbacteria bacterium RIFCSPHIGHO2_02_FULL_47_12 TaxID=1802451 RepID=A0A1G2R3K4_9BACT|nr:MAG: hypothetical protein A3C82_02695 [Candidatus Wildermuthbacteria bacterium RIFCSPHIGHO2_02_FULL_47_12]
MQQTKVAHFLLRIGLAGTLAYAAVASFLTPTSWIGFFPRFLVDFSSSFMSPEALLGSFSVLELLLAAWLLSGFKSMYAGLCAAAVFGGILFANLGALDLVFRDFGLFFASLALAVLSK